MTNYASYTAVYFYKVSELFNTSDMEKLIELTHLNEQIFMNHAKYVEDDYLVDLLFFEKYPEKYPYEDENEFHSYYSILKELLAKFRDHRKKGKLAVYYEWEDSSGQSPPIITHEVILKLKKDEEYVLSDREW